MIGFGEARAGSLKEVARRVFSVVGAIAILAVLDLRPETIAEIAVGVGIVVLLAAAVAPLRLCRNPAAKPRQSRLRREMTSIAALSRMAVPPATGSPFD